MAAAKNPTQQTALIGFLLVILGFALVFYIFSPQLITARTEYETRRAELQGLKKDVETLQSASKKLESAKAALVAAGVKLENSSIVVPKTENVPDLYLQMEDLVARTKFYVSDTTYLIGQPAGTAATAEGTTKSEVTIPVTVNFVATYPALKAFIQEMQVNTRPLSITQVTMNEIAKTTAKAAGPNDAPTKSYPDGSFAVTLTAFARAEALSSAYGGGTN